jgi:galactokinase/mevalonate kinase-like predicted kinase
MIISKTPFRISFFGGGTDYPKWYHENGGSVLATTIDKYCYISCRHLPPFFEHKHRIVYSKIESGKTTKEIQHPVVRAVLSCFYRFDFGINNTMLMLKKGWQMTAANITIFIDGSG